MVDFANPDNPFGDPWYATPTGASHQPFNNALGLPPPLPPVVAPPAPPPPGQQPWRPMDELTRQYYSDHPQEAWRQYINDLVQGGADSQFGRYLSGHAGDVQAEWSRGQEANPNLQFTDTLTRDLLTKWHTQYSQQSSADQGQQWGPNVWAGRWVG